MCVSGFLKNLFRLKTADLSTDDNQLRRCLTKLDLTLLGIASMLGVTLYVLTGVVARDAGPSIILSYALVSVAAMFAALCYAELGSIFPRTGSAYLFTYSTIGELPAFIAGWSIVLEYLLSNAILARGWSGYLDAIVDYRIQNFTARWLMGGELWTTSFLAPYPDVVAGLYQIFFVIVVALGAKVSTNCNKALLAVNFTVVAFISVGSFIFADGANWSERGFFPNGFHSTVSGAAILFIGFVGFDIIAVSSEEALDSKKGIPFAIVASILSVFLIYIVVSAGLTLAVPYYEISLRAPLATPFAVHGIHWAKYVVNVGAICSMSACILTSVFALPRMVYAMSSHGLFFSVFASVNASTKTPLVATLVFGTVSALMAVFFDIDQLSSTLSIGTLTAFTLVSASVMVIRYRPLPLHRHIQEEALTDGEDDRLPGKASFLDPKEDEEPVPGGRLKPMFRFLTWMDGCSPGTVPCTCFALTTCFQFAAVFLFVNFFDSIMACDWWTILLFILLVCPAALLALPIPFHQQVDVPTPFKVPCVPFIPMVSNLCNIILMLLLPGRTWAQFAIWTVVGLVVYFLYGYGHSKESVYTEKRYHLLGPQWPAASVSEEPLQMAKTKSSKREAKLD